MPAYDNATGTATLAQRLQSTSRGVIAIDGPSGAGKSTFADAVRTDLAARGVDSALIRTDDFATWDNPVAWWPTVDANIIRPLLRGESVRYQPQQWRGGIPVPGGPFRDLEWAPLLIIEGVSSARQAMTDRIDIGIWVDGGTEAQRLARAVARDGEGERENLLRWQAFERGWFAVDQTRERCQVVQADAPWIRSLRS